MKIKDVRPQSFVKMVRCDRCTRKAEDGESEFFEFTSIDYVAGYGSILGDQNQVEIDLCQHCLKETLGPWLRVTEPTAPSAKILKTHELFKPDRHGGEYVQDLKWANEILLNSSEDLQFADEIRQAKSEIAQGLVAPYKFGPVSEQNLTWDNMAPVGREFGSPDYDRLTNEDAKRFASDLARWIKQSSAINAGLQLDEDEASHARNVQLALCKLGQDVTIDVAASVWKHYSQSLMASWMSGAETVQSAARTLYLNCPRDSRTMNP